MPTADAPSWQLDNWRTNINASSHPPQLISLSFFNVSNARGILEGETARVTQCGPYVYRATFERFNIERAPDDSSISFEVRTSFEFVPERAFCIV